MKLTVQEWLNPATDTFDRDDFFSNIDFATYPKYRSQVVKFEEFLLRANKYQPLQMGQRDSEKQVLLVEDIPNQLYRDSKLLHNIIRRFARTSRCPLVFIISDSNSKEINVQSLFPKELITSLGICQINFNPVAPTSMSKTLTRIATAESSKGRHKFPVPSKSTIDAIAQVSGGDIRSAINALQFACLKDTGDLREVVESRAEDKKKKKKSKSYVSKNKKKGTGIDDNSLSAIGGKDTSLFLFRALGKILYCKREPKSESDPQLPFHLAHEERDKLIISPESIVERTHMTSENFTLYLHQNYLEFFDEIDDVAAVAQRFSEADHLTCQWEHRSILNQYSSSIATRGLIHHNTARRFHNVPSGGGWRPLHKPEWYEINRKYQDRCATSKALFIGEGCTPVDLQTQVIPFLALANVPLHDPAQISFLQEVGYFALQHFNTGHLGRRLDEKDLEQDEYDEDSIPSSQTRRNLHKPEIVSEQVDALSGSREEDIIIEDFVD
ncbi:cell cycle checkpoint protein RAD17-like isoform X2 [Apostichopus japonicus]